MILLDTDVLSGLMRSPVDEALTEWLKSIPEQKLALSSVKVSEIAFGLARLPAGQRKARLAAAAERLLSELEIIDFDRAMAARSGVFRAKRVASGRPMSFADSMIAACAAVLGAELATRNTRDFAGLDLALVDPWSA